MAASFLFEKCPAGPGGSAEAETGDGGKKKPRRCAFEFFFRPSPVRAPPANEYASDRIQITSGAGSSQEK
jgi:hypothetical protein